MRYRPYLAHGSPSRLCASPIATAAPASVRDFSPVPQLSVYIRDTLQHRGAAAKVCHFHRGQLNVFASSFHCCLIWGGCWATHCLLLLPPSEHWGNSAMAGKALQQMLALSGSANQRAAMASRDHHDYSTRPSLEVLAAILCHNAWQGWGNEGGCVAPGRRPDFGYRCACRARESILHRWEFAKLREAANQKKKQVGGDKTVIRERSEGEAVVLCRDMASGLGGGVRVIFLQGCGSRPNEEKHILVRRCCCHQHFSKEVLLWGLLLALAFCLVP